MAAGLGLLGLAPKEFWWMTPRELEAALRGKLGPQVSTHPLTRDELGRLMNSYPDDGG